MSIGSPSRIFFGVLGSPAAVCGGFNCRVTEQVKLQIKVCQKVSDELLVPEPRLFPKSTLLRRLSYQRSLGCINPNPAKTCRTKPWYFAKSYFVGPSLVHRIKLVRCTFGSQKPRSLFQNAIKCSQQGLVTSLCRRTPLTAASLFVDFVMVHTLSLRLERILSGGSKASHCVYSSSNTIRGKQANE